MTILATYGGPRFQPAEPESEAAAGPASITALMTGSAIVASGSCGRMRFQASRYGSKEDVLSPGLRWTALRFSINSTGKTHAVKGFGPSVCLVNVGEGLLEFARI